MKYQNDITTNNTMYKAVVWDLKKEISWIPVSYSQYKESHKASWALKNRCFGTVLLEKTLESPLDCKEIKPVHPKGNQFWIFIGRTNAGAPILWPPNAKNWLIGKDTDAGKDWRQKGKETTEDEIVGWYHQLDGDEFEQPPGVGDGQGSLGCCNPWGRKESDTTEWLNWQVVRILEFSVFGISLYIYCFVLLSWGFSLLLWKQFAPTFSPFCWDLNDQQFRRALSSQMFTILLQMEPNHLNLGVIYSLYIIYIVTEMYFSSLKAYWNHNDLCHPPEILLLTKKYISSDERFFFCSSL